MSSLRRFEGELTIDHRGAGEGFSEELARSIGLPAGAGRGFFQCPTITCSHCQLVLIVNRLRTRERGYCTGCDHYICDGCEFIRTQNGGVCRTFKQIMDEVQEAAVKGVEPSPIILP